MLPVGRVETRFCRSFSSLRKKSLQDFETKNAMCNNVNHASNPSNKSSLCCPATCLWSGAETEVSSINFMERSPERIYERLSLSRRTMLDVNMLTNFPKRVALLSDSDVSDPEACVDVTSPFRGNTPTLFTSARKKGNRARSHERKRKRNLPGL